MLIQHNQEKLINAIIYFVKNTRFCGKTKLYKLLYFLDFEHFSITGRSVTGLDYYAWPKGPVPRRLHDEFDTPSDSTSSALNINSQPAANGKLMLDIKPKRDFSSEHFTKRELKILAALCDEFKDAYADDMVEATHLENLPWNQIYNVEGRKQDLIPYELSLRKSEYDQIIKNVVENNEFRENYN